MVRTPTLFYNTCHFASHTRHVCGRRCISEIDDSRLHIVPRTDASRLIPTLDTSGFAYMDHIDMDVPFVLAMLWRIPFSGEEYLGSSGPRDYN